MRCIYIYMHILSTGWHTAYHAVWCPGPFMFSSLQSADWCTLEWRKLHPFARRSSDYPPLGNSKSVKHLHDWPTAQCSPGVWVPSMAAMSTSRPHQDLIARIASTECSSHPYNCRQFVMGRASSSTTFWGVLAPSMTSDS